MQSGNRLHGKIALITGAASGLGAAMAARFLQEGASVVLTDVNEGALQGAGLEGEGEILKLRHDVTSPQDWANVIGKTRDRLGGLHILVNNAGIVLMGSVEDISLDDWRRIHAVDLDSVFLGCKTSLPLMAATTAQAGSRGAILNISSVSAIIAGHNLAGYNSAKAAVRHLTKSVALHCARKGYRITCNSLHPAFISTPLIDGLGKSGDQAQVRDKLARQIPLGCLGDPDDVAHAAVYLCSDEAKFVTGAELLIDGGIAAM
ncbi:MAG: SDR family oxidoreductase [Sphingomonadales bacterium]|nr:SDR family oxidoreductase [Sphingomonadales bacterium]